MDKESSKYHLDTRKGKVTHSDCGANRVGKHAIGYQIREATRHSVGENFVNFNHDNGDEMRNFLAGGDEFVKISLKG